jgi:hypothetical protein
MSLGEPAALLSSTTNPIANCHFGRQKKRREEVLNLALRVGIPVPAEQQRVR